jgi:hypothetical protein
MKIFLLILFFPILSWSQAEFVADRNLSSDGSETVIEDQYFISTSMEEPIFANRKRERDLAANPLETSTLASPEWQGELSIQKEIPYSYPWYSHSTMALRVLNEIEQEEKEASQ